MRNRICNTAFFYCISLTFNTDPMISDTLPFQKNWKEDYIFSALPAANSI